MMIELIAVSKLRPYAKNARNHSKKQIQQIADSIKTFGFTNPVLIGDDNEIIAGHGRVDAARLLRMDAVPSVTSISSQCRAASGLCHRRQQAGSERRLGS
jgi:ParB-like chromosome segregation protein Spo0J